MELSSTTRSVYQVNTEYIKQTVKIINIIEQKYQKAGYISNVTMYSNPDPRIDLTSCKMCIRLFTKFTTNIFDL